MSNCSWWAIVLVAGLFSTSANAEEVLIRLQWAEVQNDTYEKVKDVNRSASAEMARWKKEGIEPDLVELHAKVGEPFYSKTKIGKRSITFHGILKANADHSGLLLEFQAAKKTLTGEFIPRADGGRDELSNQTKFQSTIALEKEETQVIGGVTRSTEMTDAEKRTMTEYTHEILMLSLAAPTTEE